MYQIDTRMPGPATEQDALTWIQDALRNGRYIYTAHFWVRCDDRDISILDVKRAVERAYSCETYKNGKPMNGGTCWRVTGPDFAGDATSIGVEAFTDHLGKRAVLCTVF